MRQSAGARGSYVLVIHLREGMATEVGSLGQLRFSAGWYSYVGSAMAGLKERIRRHFNEKKTPRWHIDYITNKVPAESVVLFHGERRLECDIANSLKRALACVPGFGSSDCDCESHLFFTSDRGEMNAALEKIIAATEARPRVLRRKDVKAYLGLSRI